MSLGGGSWIWVVLSVLLILTSSCVHYSTVIGVTTYDFLTSSATIGDLYITLAVLLLLLLVLILKLSVLLLRSYLRLLLDVSLIQR